jgi:hypothetical protein
MRDNDIRIGDLIEQKIEKSVEYGIVIKICPGFTPTSYCQPTVMWEDGRVTTNVSSAGMKIIVKKL